MSEQIDTIVVGVDGSDVSRRAFEWAAALAEQLDAGLVVVHAAGLVEHRDDPNQATLRAWLDGLKTPAAWVERVVREGDPIIVIEQVVAERGAQLVVVGARGIGEASAAALGSTSSRLVRRSTVPVTVVPSA